MEILGRRRKFGKRNKVLGNCYSIPSGKKIKLILSLIFCFKSPILYQEVYILMKIPKTKVFHSLFPYIYLF